MTIVIWNRKLNLPDNRRPEQIQQARESEKEMK